VATDHVQEARSYDQRGLELAKGVADRPGATGEQMYNYAWLAVTVDPADLRNPAGALPYAIKAVELSKSQEPLCLHVLSQAYSELGDYRRAVEVEEKALELFAPVEAGKPAPRNRGIVERSLGEYRKELAKRGQ
jgi:tetratricopeptide (TPR) repeat protein